MTLRKRKIEISKCQCCGKEIEWAWNDYCNKCRETYELGVKDGKLKMTERLLDALEQARRHD